MSDKPIELLYHVRLYVVFCRKKLTGKSRKPPFVPTCQLFRSVRLLLLLEGNQGVSNSKDHGLAFKDDGFFG